MTRLMIAGYIVFCTSIGAFAQETRDAIHGYVFFAPGVSAPGGEGLTHIGGGGEKLFKGIGAGAEIGYLAPFRYFRDGIGVLSPNGSYHFTNGKVSPFVTGGYSLFFRDGHVNGFNYGGGVNYWVREKTALRFEVRDNALHRDVHFIGFRVGITTR